MEGCYVCAVILTEAGTHLMENEHWVVSLAPKQDYWGRCFVTLKRHCESLANLETSEWLSLQPIVKTLETALAQAFGAAPCNWGCLMNAAYQEKPFHPHVHFHVRPRYEKPLTIAGHTFVDEAFGNHYLHFPQRAPQEVHTQIERMLREALEQVTIS